MDAFALLDDAHATPARPTSRLLTGFVRTHRCTDPATLAATCAAIEDDLARGLHGVLLADYEWGAKLLHAGDAGLAAGDPGALRVLMFERLQRLDAAAVAGWLAGAEGRAEPSAAGAFDLRPTIGRAAFDAAIGRIHAAIRDGETYQVNFTYRLRGQAFGDPVALYRRLRARQDVDFGALIRLPAGDGDACEWVLSRSPELFLRHAGGRLQARPMKGTAVRALPPEGDSETARMLHEDVKNRAENLMIVDLLRNDLGRIARIGSVKVPELFSIEPYATVYQMTSTIEAARRPEVGLAGLLAAMFPCGSITGAPKHRTMEWIAALESTPRGLYTGAIGWLDAPSDPAQGRCPDLCFSVAIRTLVLGAAGEGGGRPLELGVGGGIVQDSVAADEWQETRWKARFLTALDPGLELFETVLATRAEGPRHRERHRARIAASAAALGFAFDAAAFDARLDAAWRAACHEHPGAGAFRLRIALGPGGALAARCVPLAPLDPPGSAAAPVRLRCAAEPLAPHALAAHKTTLREAYDAGIRAAEAEGAFDTLFFAPDGRLLEGGRSNVFLHIDGRWCTPPVADGVLPGVMRAQLLADPALAAEERRLTRADLARAERILVCNALRGALEATLADPGALR